MTFKDHFKGLITIAIIVFVGAIFCATSALAVNNFDVQAADKTLDQLTIQLSTEELNVKHLENAIDKLTNLQNKAKQCVEEAQTELKSINQRWEEVSIDTKETTALTSLQKYLKTKQTELTDRQSECRLFVLRSEEAIIAFSTTVKKLTTKRLLEAQTTFLAKIKTSTTFIEKLHKQFNKNIFWQQSGFKTLKGIALIIFIGLIMIGILIGTQTKIFLNRYIAEKADVTITDKLTLAFSQVGRRYALLLTLAALLTLFSSALSLLENQLTYFMLLTYGLLIYGLILGVIHFFFTPYQPKTFMSGLPSNIACPLGIRLKILTHLCFIAYITYVLFYQQPLPLPLVDLARTIFITILAINIISLLWLVNRIPGLLERRKFLRFLVSLILTLGLLTIIIAEWMGYQQLVTYLLQGITLSLSFAFIAWLLHKIFNFTLTSFSHDQLPLQENLRKRLGLKLHETPPELLLLRVILYILVWGGLLLALLKAWGLAETNFRHIVDALINGFKIGNITLVPSKILLAGLFFIIFFLLIRWLRKTLERHRRRDITDLERDSQKALAAFVGYAGMLIAIIIALLISGVNFAGLAIIAGALSVGIGFGLQNIVNNFLSGIILLIERPIKPGDRVIIGEVEGYVKKIRLRFTQIKTLELADLIVPNSEIISGKVTNLMYHDFYGRINIIVGVAYNSDTELVNKIMLDVATSHPEVVTDDSTRPPKVYFLKFEDSSLQFGLYCLIKNVNLKYVVISELHHAMTKAFRENNITIAYPQQDIHIRDWPNETLKNIPKKAKQQSE